MNIFLILIFFIIILVIIYYLHENNILPNNYIQFSNINNNCLYKRFGCCNDKITPKLNSNGTNCRGF
jgi:hypothetical protein